MTASPAAESCLTSREVPGLFDTRRSQKNVGRPKSKTVTMRMLFIVPVVVAVLGCARSPDESSTSAEAPNDDHASSTQLNGGHLIERLVGIGAKLEFNDDGRVSKVNLADSGISDTDLDHLRRLTAITHLHLEGTNVTDAGLAHLADLSSLRLINVGGTKVSRDGRRRLRRVLPQATVFPLDLSTIDDAVEPVLHDEPDSSPEVVLGDDNDAQELEGSWRIIEYYSDGHRLAEEEGSLMLFVGNTMIFQNTETNEQDDVEVTLQTAKRPKHISWSYTDGETIIQFRGIYSLQGDRLIICVAVQGERPTKFEAREGDLLMLFVLGRW